MLLLDKMNSRSSSFGTDLNATRGKTIGEFSNEEWDKLLSKVDNAIEDYKEDLKEREEEALEKQKKQAEQYIHQQRSGENLEYEQNVMMGGALNSMRFQRLNGNMFSSGESAEEKPDVEGSVEDFISEEAIQKLTTEALVGERGKTPYSVLDTDRDGMIEYNGVIFVGDEKTNSICLGDVTSDPNNVLSVPLSGGGYLKVNLDNLDSLAKAIGMFSPEDQNRIMRAIAQHNRIKQIEQQIEDETSGLKVLEKNEDAVYYV